MTDSKAKTKAKDSSGAARPRTAATKSKAASKAGTKAKVGASQAKPLKRLAASAPALAGKSSHEQATGKPASRLIDQRIIDLGDWRGETLAQMRALILQADPEMIEEWKWRGTPVWSHQGIVCTGETYKTVVKLTFAHGASLPDPAHLFNSSLEGNTRRAIDIHEGEQVNAGALKALIKAAVTRNGSPAKKAKAGASR